MSGNVRMYVRPLVRVSYCLDINGAGRGGRCERQVWHHGSLDYMASKARDHRNHGCDVRSWIEATVELRWNDHRDHTEKPGDDWWREGADDGGA